MIDVRFLPEPFNFDFLNYNKILIVVPLSGERIVRHV